MVSPPRAGLAWGGDRGQNKPEPQLAACALFRGKGVGQRRPAVGPCPPLERRTFSTAQIFMSTIFSKKRGEQTWEDGNESNTRGTWLRRRAHDRRLSRAGPRHGEDRADQCSLRPIRRCRHPVGQRR